MLRFVALWRTWVPGEVLAEIKRRTPVDGEAWLRDISDFDEDDM